MNQRTNQPWKNVRALALGCVLLGSAGLAWAQADTEPRPMRRPAQGDENGRPMMPGGFSQFGPGLARFFGVLTPDQRASLREAIEDQRAQAGDLEQQLHAARVDLFMATVAEKFDEDAVRQKSAALAKLEAKRNFLFAKAVSQMRPRLTDEQIDKIKNPGPIEPGEGQAPPRPRHPLTPHDDNGLPPKDAPPTPQPKPL